MFKLMNFILEFPERFTYDIAKPIDAMVDWIDKVFREALDVFVIVFTFIINRVQDVLFFIPWWGYVILLFFATMKLYKVSTAIVLSSLLLLIGVFGFWDATIRTFAIIVVSVLICFIIGLPIGISMAKSRRVEMVLKPILDGMQTLPSFVYLIPALMLFNTFGRVPAVFATTIYALPPLIRLTYLGITNVDEQVVEAGTSFGSTPMQMLFKIEIPQAMSTIAAGVNQTTMMAVAMVVIAAMIGTPGVGRDVLRAVETLQVGDGFAAGFAIVFLAIILDRLLQGLAAKLDTTAQEGEE